MFSSGQVSVISSNGRMIRLLEWAEDLEADLEFIFRMICTREAAQKPQLLITKSYPFQEIFIAKI